MKTEEKRHFSYKNLVFVASLAGLFSFIAVPSWNRQREEDRLINAKRQAEVLGYQVFEIYREASQAVATAALNSRSPAAMRTNGGDVLNFRDAGSIGNDPWGQPYRYKILSHAGEPLKVQIWSAGPNQAFETEDLPGTAADSYVGDDVGVVLAMGPHPSTD